MAQRKSVNITILAAKLNLSVTTVSRVLNGKAKQFRIKEETEQKVREAASELNYTPNRFARGLKLDKSETIGIVVPDISNPFFADIIKSVEKACKEKGYAMLIGDSDENTQQEIEIVGLFESRKVDGLIIAPVGIDFDHLIKPFNAGIPMVLIDRWNPEILIPTITSDNYKGAYDATQFLIEHGHRNIACIQGLNESRPNIERVSGYVDAMRKYGIVEIYSPIPGSSFSIENGYKHACELLSLSHPPSAILALNNRISLGILKAATEKWISIPDDLSLITFDEQAYSAFLNTPMTTIEQNKTLIGAKAVELLLKQIDGEVIAEQNLLIKIPSKMNIRKSVRKIN